MADEIFPNSSKIIRASRLPSPWPPYSSGVLMPRNPISPILANTSFGTGLPDSSNSTARSVNSF